MLSTWQRITAIFKIVSIWLPLFIALAPIAIIHYFEIGDLVRVGDGAASLLGIGGLVLLSNIFTAVRITIILGTLFMFFGILLFVAQGLVLGLSMSAITIPTDFFIACSLFYLLICLISTITLSMDIKYRHSSATGPDEVPLSNVSLGEGD